jgi:hypothetical protein
VNTYLASAFRKAAHHFDPRTAPSPLDKLLQGEKELAEIEP